MIKSEVIPCLQDAMQTLQNIWSEIGLEEEQKEERTKSVLFHLRSLLQQMVSEEEELKSTLQANVETCTQELEKLSKELGLPMFKVSDVKIGFPDTCNQQTVTYLVMMILIYSVAKGILNHQPYSLFSSGVTRATCYVCLETRQA